MQVLPLLLLLAAVGNTPAAAAVAVEIPAGSFESVIAPTEETDTVVIEAFEIAASPVTEAEFQSFVSEEPRWRRDRAAGLFVDSSYLTHWASAETHGPDVRGDAPVTRVSWYAARAYCESQGGRLPTWYEWEYVAAADETRPDARGDPAWRQRILDWYSIRGDRPLPPVGKTPANAYGVRDMHGVIWEWVEDYNALLVSSDNREQGGADRLQFCGAGAVAVNDKENYAVLMRTAYLSSLEASFTTRNLGFRCAWEVSP